MPCSNEPVTTQRTAGTTQHVPPVQAAVALRAAIRRQYGVARQRRHRASRSPAAGGGLRTPLKRVCKTQYASAMVSVCPLNGWQNQRGATTRGRRPRHVRIVPTSGWFGQGKVAGPQGEDMPRCEGARFAACYVTLTVAAYATYVVVHVTVRA